jgi:3-methyladenine DNA glycosylase AlkD
MTNQLRRDLLKKANKEKAKILQGFFKTGKGEYGEGDVFLGITVPEVRKIAKKYVDLELKDLEEGICSKFHEERQACLFVLAEKFGKAKEKNKEDTFNFYIENRKYINNWDLVDLTAPKIVGAWLDSKDKSLLYRFASSKDIWERRIAILSTFYYIKKGDCDDALSIAEVLKNDSHDLIQKAVGWMLREIGKSCGQEKEEEFLKKNCRMMPRTMLRYAIEKFPEKKRKFYLNNKQ